MVGMEPRVKLWNLAVAATFRRLILAVNGLASVNEVDAIPVLTMSVGKTSDADLMRVWCRAGIVTGERRICDNAD